MVDFSRTATRRLGAAVSYKEASDEQTDSSDLLEGDGDIDVEPEPEEHSETIERVLGHRRGKKGGNYMQRLDCVYLECLFSKLFG